MTRPTNALTALAAGLALGLSLLAGCGDSSDEDSVRRTPLFCQALLSSCHTGTSTQCETLLAADALDNPTCLSERNSLLDCMARQTMVCPDSHTVYAGAGASNGMEFQIMGYVAYTGDACRYQGKSYQTCVDPASACEDGPDSYCPISASSDSSHCVDLMTDRKNCGSCGNVCSSATSCRDGSCSCSGDLTECESGSSSTCVDLDRSSQHCGACGNKCPLGTTCNGGQCVCGEGFSLECPDSPVGACWSGPVACETATTCPDGTSHACRDSGTYLDCATMKCLTL